ncbi:MAG: hypothetical protein ACJ798_19150 [Phenylobacterium sp.]
MDDERETFGLPALVGDRRWWGRVSVGMVRELLARTAEGESLRSVCRDPRMPSTRTICRWARERPTFAARLLAARQASGQPLRAGGRSSYCVATAEALLARICAGESLSRICRDPDMPVAATVYTWREARPEFAEALAVAFDLRAEGFFDRGWELAEAATPETAYLTHVRLMQLRWHVGKLAPKKYGLPVQMEGGADKDDPDRQGLTVIIKRFSDVTPEEQAAADATEAEDERRERARRRW